MIKTKRYSLFVFIYISIICITSCDVVFHDDAYYAFYIHNKTDKTVTVYFSDTIKQVNYTFSRERVGWGGSVPSTIIDVKPDSLLRLRRGIEGWPDRFEKDGIIPIWFLIDSIIIDNHIVYEKWKDQDAWYSDVTDDWAIYDLYIRNSIEP
jgi:hypothetical protein